MAEVLEKLSKGGLAEVLMSSQIAFDMYESATHQFLPRYASIILGGVRL